MIRHLLKLVWNRKGANALITLEIFLSLLVVFVLTVIAIYHGSNFRRPLGYEIDNVWCIDIRFDPGEREHPGKTGITAQRILRETDSLDPVVQGAFSFACPYFGGAITTVVEFRGDPLRYEVESATPELREVLGIELVRGRWFEPADIAMGWLPVVINGRLAAEAFGDEDPLGQRLGEPEAGEKPRRVVGVVADHRRHGELSGPRNVVIEPMWLEDPEPFYGLSMLLAVRPATPAAFEDELVKRLERVVPTWSFTVQPLAQVRENYLVSTLAPLLIAAIVTGFLMIMVALGLLGVLWQNVTRRTREMGLRRAKGATAGAVRRQILIEVTLMTSFAVVVAAVIAAQLWLTGLFGPIDFGVYALAFVLAAAVIYLLTLLCGLYPSWLATRIHPAEALHYE